MTEVYLHGILGKKYGKRHRFAVSKPKDALLALEANYEGFLKELKELSRKNIYYSWVADNQCLGNRDSNFCLSKVKKLDFVPTIVGGGPFAIAAAIIVSVASAVYSYVQAGKVEYPKIPGAEGATSANNRSLAFSNRENITEQGNPVPLVYGRIKVGSAVIQSSVKSFPLSISLVDEYLNTSSKKSNNLSAVISDENNAELL